MRKILIGSLAVVGLMGLGACKTSARDVEQERKEAARKEASANKEIAEIRQDANKDQANREHEAQKDIAEEKREVAEERQDVAQAEAERQRDMARDNDNDLLDNDRDYRAGDNRNLDAAPGANAMVVGTLKSTLGQQITIADGKGGEFKLGTDDATHVTQNGAPVDIDDFKEGSEVRASYTLDGEKKVAREVVILNSYKK
jgi:hypothetical protein